MLKPPILIAAACLFVCVAIGCSPDASGHPATGSEASTESMQVRVSSLKGPTSLGIANLIHEVKAGEAETENSYAFSIVGTADEILPSLIRGETDIALIPANAASVVYNKTEGGIKVFGVNTLGVLSVVSGDKAISSITDLTGRTLLMTGKGTTPEYVMQTILEEEGIADKVDLEFKSEATELAAAIIADPTAIAVLPEPYATAVIAKSPRLERVISVTDAWKAVTGEDLVTGVTVVRTEFAEAHPEVIREFLTLQAASAASANNDPATTASRIVELGIIDDEQIAQAAIPGSNIVCLTGDQMKASLSKYLTVLYARDPSSIGGALPEDSFYLVP